ncbi:MAG: aryldialkylphosphatase [Phycisphaerales bacterium]|nr:aryldialkylphosphatase [Phycisphaerales bacterium]
MKFIRTVLGDIAPEDLGACYAHEHIIIDESFTIHQYPELQLNNVEKGIEELKAFHAAGGRAMVDSMPCACGRNVMKLAAISRATGVHILCPTGLHLQKYYPPGHWSQHLSEDELANLFVADIQQGIDVNDYNGPQCQRSNHKAGLIKIASGLDHLDEHTRRLFAAAAQTHRRTGAPILTHTEQGTAALEQIEFLGGHGVDLAQVVISHTDRKPDLAYHRQILASGVKVEYDSGFRWKNRVDNPTLTLVARLIHEFPHQILLGMDAAKSTYWSSYGGKPGHTFLLTTFSTMLKQAGLTEADLHRIFVENPRLAYTFAAAE